MAVELATAYVSLTTSAKGITSSIQSELGDPLTSAGSKAGDDTAKSFGSKFSGGLSSVMSGIQDPFGSIRSSAESAAGGLEHAEGSAGGLVGALTSSPYVAAGAVILGVAGAATALGEKFDETTAKIAAAAGISQSAANSIGSAFLQTAGTTTFTGQAIAEAYAGVAGQLGTVNGAALTAKQAMDVMTPAMDLAEASGTSLASAASDVSKTLQAFQLPVTQAGLVTDVLYQTANKTGVSVDSMSTSIDRARSTMGSAAPSISELGGLLLDLTQHGETGRQAMSTLSSAFNGILTPTAAATAAQNAMGVSFVNAKGQLDPLSEIIGQLQPKLAGMGNAQATATLTALGFGSASSKLVGVIQAGSTAFDLDTLAVSKHGAAADAAGKTTDTFSGAWKKISSAVIDVATDLGRVLAPVLTKLMLDLASGVAWINTNWPTISKVIGVVIDAVKPFFDSFIEKIQGTIQVVQGLVDFVVDVFEGKWGAAWDAIKEITSGAIEELKGFFQPLISAFQMVLGPAVSAFQAIWDGAWSEVSTALSTAWSAMQAVFGFIKTLGIDYITVVIDAFQIEWAVVWTAVSTALSAAWTAMSAVFGFIKTLGTDIVSGAISALQTAWDAAWNLISGAVSTAWSVMGTVFSTIKTAGTDIVSAAIGALQSAWNAFWNGAGAVVSAAWSGISATMGIIKGAINGVISVINGLISAYNAIPLLPNVSKIPTIGSGTSLSSAASAGISNVSLGARALGGPVSAHTPYIVGEDGPELFMPGSSGSIVPHSAMAAYSAQPPSQAPSFNPTVNINGSGLTEEQLLRVANKAIKASHADVVARAKAYGRRR